MEYKITIADDFSITPGSRYPEEGDFSGQEFREEILKPIFIKAQEENKILIVDIDNTIGYGTSFLEEVFGGLAREFSSEKVLKGIKVVSFDEDYLIDDINEYIKSANG